MSKIRLIVTSDTHAQWHHHPKYENLSLKNTSQLIKTLQKSTIPTLQFDLGDFIQGSAMATYTSQITKSAAPYARMMNALGYDYQIIGNHEFNHGIAYQESALKHLNAQVLCSNIIDQSTNQPYMGKAYDIFEMQGFQIGIIGVTTHYIPHWELPENYQGLEFLDAFKTVKKYVQLLRPQVDLLIVAYHGGFEADLDNGQALESFTGENQAFKMINEIPEIDILLTGHQHRQICQSFKQSFVIQPGYGGERVGEIQVVLEKDRPPQIKGQLHSFETYEAINSLEPLEPEYSQSTEWLEHVLGNAPLKLPTNDLHQARIEGLPFTEFLLKLMLEQTQADFAAISLLNEHFVNFQGPVTRGELLAIYPYYNKIALSEVSGQDLYDAMEHNFAYFMYDQSGKIIVNPSYVHPKPKHYNYDLYSGLGIEVDLNQPIGNRVVRLIDERTNTEIDRNETYQLALTQYRAVGGGDYLMFTKDKLKAIYEKDMVELIVEGLEKMSSEQWDDVNENYSHIQWIAFTKN